MLNCLLLFIRYQHSKRFTLHVFYIKIILISLFIISEKYYLCTRFNREVLKQHRKIQGSNGFRMKTVLF